MGELSSLRFAAVARELGQAGRRRGMEVPAFRSPPRSPGVRRAIRRERDGSATVSVALRGRPAVAVVADMIDGMVAAAHVGDIEAGAVRDELWAAALPLVVPTAPTTLTTPSGAACTNPAPPRVAAA
ncbi:MAG: hypothetical protein R2761_20875 [Acidimicrobiales bacterium]